eukprot:8614320-Karenia_brevis.AAC.1
MLEFDFTPGWRHKGWYMFGCCMVSGSDNLERRRVDYPSCGYGWNFSGNSGIFLPGGGLGAGRSKPVHQRPNSECSSVQLGPQAPEVALSGKQTAVIVLT